MAASQLELRSGSAGSWPIGTIPYERGYARPPSIREAVAEAHRTSLLRTTAATALEYSIAIAAATASIAAIRHWPLYLAAPVVGVALVAIARVQRALECLVHEASHYNWSRSRRVNDVLADTLVAAPVLSRVARYRRGHLVHHARFGTPADPDLRRYREFDLEGIDRCTRVAFVQALFSRALPYAVGWWSAIGTDRRAVVRSMGWYGVAVAVTTLFVGLMTAVLAWAVWWVALLVVLPFIRLVGESSEHIYAGTSTVFDATITNTGHLQRLFIHPHGDAFHTLHHLWPRVPHHRLESLHSALCTMDIARYGSQLRRRRRVRDRPTLSRRECVLLGRSRGREVETWSSPSTRRSSIATPRCTSEC
ncbi:MAG: fatty acid desaturase family protein [Acidimicrobiales bacterium]